MTAAGPAIDPSMWYALGKAARVLPYSVGQLRTRIKLGQIQHAVVPSLKVGGRITYKLPGYEILRLRGAAAVAEQVVERPEPLEKRLKKCLKPRREYLPMTAAPVATAAVVADPTAVLVRRALTSLLPAGQVTELRAPNAKGKGDFTATISGYFDDMPKLVAASHEINAPGIYMVLNPVDPSLLARCNNRAKKMVKGDASTTDKDVLARRWLFVEVDPNRPSGICATDEEKAKAKCVADAVLTNLRSDGWPEPMQIDSGNGYYLLFRVDLPTDDGGLSARCLKALATKFDTDAAHIDVTVFNPARIARVPGSWNKKGDRTPDRPWRKSAPLAVPNDLLVVPVELLEALAGAAPVPEKKKATTSSNTAATSGEYAHRLVVPQYLDHFGVEVTGTAVGAEGQTKWFFTCPFNPDHKGRDAFAYQYLNGAVGFHCSHNSCAGNRWDEFKEKVGKPRGGHYDPPMLAEGMVSPDGGTPVSLASLGDLAELPDSELPPGSHSVPEPSDGNRTTGGEIIPPANDPPATNATPDQPRGRVDPHTDLANGRRFAQEHRDEARFSFPEGVWYVWDGMRWKRDNTGAVELMAKNTTERMLENARLLAANNRGSVNHERVAGQLELWAVKSQQLPRIDAMLKMARSEPGMAVLPERFDADPWALNCVNGTVDLRTGELRPHCREDMITALCPHEYHPAAGCTTWERNLLSTFDGSVEMVSFIRRLYGYSASGDTSVAVLPVFWGKGSNGKSTLRETMFKVLGPDYACKASKDLLLATKGDKHPTELADLKGKRMVVAMETEEGRRLNESLIKELTGGDRIKARRMREDFWEFDATHKLFLGTNSKPVVRTGGHGTWRRLLLVPFTQRFWKDTDTEKGPEHLKADLTLKEKLAEESAGILAWLVRGCLEWLRDGRNLAVPDQVSKATSEYQAEEDVFAPFFNAYYERHEGSFVVASELYKKFVEWFTKEEGEEAKKPSKKWVSNRLGDLGIDKKASNGEVKYIGLRLRATHHEGNEDIFGDKNNEPNDSVSNKESGDHRHFDATRPTSEDVTSGDQRRLVAINDTFPVLSHNAHAHTQEVNLENDSYRHSSPLIATESKSNTSNDGPGFEQLWDLLDAKGLKWTQVVEWLNTQHSANLPRDAGLYQVNNTHRQLAFDWLTSQKGGAA